MKLYIITGEPSGDFHAANIVKSLQSQQKIYIRAWGGNHLIKQGVTIARNIKNTSFMGFVDVILNINKVYNNLKYCKSDIINYKPDIVLLVDYPAFNLKIAKFCKSNNIKVIYFIAPKVWAWNSRRVLSIKRYVDKLLVVFPFEVKYFQQKSILAEYVGNPLVDITTKHKFKNINYKKPVIALLPGSRKQEIKSILPKMLEVVDDFPDYHFVIAAINDFSESYYRQITDKYNNIDILFDQTYDILNTAQVALVVSGTANLEASLLKTPQIVCYKTHFLNFLLARFLLNIKYISLPNILLNKEVIPELIQGKLSKKNLTYQIRLLINGKQDVESNYIQLIDSLGTNNTYSKVANAILKCF